MNSSRRGRGGRPKSVGQKKDKRMSFKWSSDIHYRMAAYLRDNYVAYKAALSSSRKIHFLRQMRDSLGLPIDDTKMKNGFINFMKKFDEVKTKLNSSGFGIDPEKDSTLEKGWILKVCPYYDVLDQVMGCRPNVTPPAVVSTSAINDGSPNPSDVNCDAEVEEDEEELMDIEASRSKDPLEDPVEHESTNQSTENALTDEKQDYDLKKMVKNAFHGLQKNGSDANPKSAVGIYSKIMSEKLHQSSKIEREKLKQSQAQFIEDIKLQTERNQIELLKVTKQTEMEQKQIDLESQRLADKTAEREHELTKLKLEHDFELKRLELQLKLKQN